MINIGLKLCVMIILAFISKTNGLKVRVSNPANNVSQLAKCLLFVDCTKGSSDDSGCRVIRMKQILEVNHYGCTLNIFLNSVLFFLFVSFLCRPRQIV